MNHANWTFTEAYSLPVKLREWFIERIMRDLEDKAE
jgi:hypothetical protein